MSKKAFLAIIFILLLGVAVLGLSRLVVPSSVPVISPSTKIPDQIYLAINKQQVIVDEQSLLKQFHALVKAKRAKLISEQEAAEINSKGMIYLGYGNPDKGPGFSIDEQGRMLTTIYKSQLRNKSRIHWLWWKIDAYFGDDSTALYYLTGPDQTGAQLLGEFKSFQVPKLEGPKLLPLNEAGLNPDFKEFWDNLIRAVAEKNVEFIKEHLDEAIQASFGDGPGIPIFLKYWGLDANAEKSRFWGEMAKVLELGGAFRDSQQKNFIAPYVTAKFPVALDQYEYVAILEDNVKIYAEPDPGSKVIARSGYNVVRLAFWEFQQPQGENKYPNKELFEEIAVGKNQKGYVERVKIRSPLDYRAGFELKNGAWKIIYFIAGD